MFGSIFIASDVILNFPPNPVFAKESQSNELDYKLAFGTHYLARNIQISLFAYPMPNSNSGTASSGGAVMYVRCPVVSYAV